MDMLQFGGSLRHLSSSPNVLTHLSIPVTHNQGENVGPNSPNGADAAGAIRGVSKIGFPKQSTNTSTPTSPRNSPLRQAVARLTTGPGTPPRDPSPPGKGRRLYDDRVQNTGNTLFRGSKKRKVGTLTEQPRLQESAQNPTGYSPVPQKRNCLQPRSRDSPLAHIAAVAQQRSRSSSESSTDSTIESTDKALTPERNRHQLPQPQLLGLAQMQQNPAAAYHMVQHHPTNQLAMCYARDASFTPSARGPGASTLPVALTPGKQESWAATNVQTVPQTKVVVADSNKASKKRVRKPKRDLVASSIASLSAAAANSSCDASAASSSDAGGADSSIPKKCGRWTDEEHKVFVRGLRKHGKNWSIISQMVRTRTTVQVRTHAQKYFIKQQRAGLDPMEGVGSTVDGGDDVTSTATATLRASAVPDTKAQEATIAAATAVAASVKRAVEAEKTRKSTQRRPRANISCTGGPSRLKPASERSGPRNSYLYPRQPGAGTVRPPRVLTSGSVMGQYRSHSFATMGFPMRLPSVLLNRPHSPASTRTIQTAAAHLVNLYDLGGGQNSGICEAVY
jgi:SHAQKYF class myb-like DNA-binding protein